MTIFHSLIGGEQEQRWGNGIIQTEAGVVSSDQRKLPTALEHSLEWISLLSDQEQQLLRITGQDTAVVPKVTSILTEKDPYS